MRRHWAEICGVVVLVCAMCVASSAGGADLHLDRRANEANERVCSRSATQGTRAGTRHGGHVSAVEDATQGTQAEACATESVALARSAAEASGVAQAQVAAQAGAAELHLLPRPREVDRKSVV